MSDTSQQSPRELLLSALELAWKDGYPVSIVDAGDGSVFVSVKELEQITVLFLPIELVVRVYRDFQRMSEIRVDMMQGQESQIIRFTLNNQLTLTTFVLSPDLFNNMKAPLHSSSVTGSPTNASDQPPIPPAAN